MSGTLQLVPVIAKPLCADADPALWYPAPHDRVAEAQAQAICYACPLRDPCYAGAVERGEAWGIWGAVNFDPQESLLLDPDADQCYRGHIFTEATTYWTPDGHRECRICRRITVNERARRKREALGATCGNKHVRTARNTYRDSAERMRCRDCIAELAAKRANEKEVA